MNIKKIINKIKKNINKLFILKKSYQNTLSNYKLIEIKNLNIINDITYLS